jgi:CheY-like chemotaxis protein
LPDEFPTSQSPLLHPANRFPAFGAIFQMTESSASLESSSEKKRVLLVEDHQDTRETLAALLRKWGYEVETAGTVAAGAEKARPGFFQMVISDIGLPDATGNDLIRQLKSINGRQRAIAISGFGMEQDVTACMEAGFDRHLTKPVSPQRLRETIEELLQQS